MTVVLVVPSNRPAGLMAFLDAWDPLPFDRIIVVEDGPTATIEHAAVDVFSWSEIEQQVPDPAIFSRRDSAIRCFGFWRAYADGADTVITLDDDCFPVGEPSAFVQEHLRVLYETPAWETTAAGTRVRGLPYRNLGRLPVALNMGLWLGTPDLDSVHSLAYGTRQGIDPEVAGTSRIMPSARWWPMSGMNVAATREALPLLYFPPMGAGQPYSRFDDIWCGLALQRVARHLGWNLACGSPAVDHQRASDPFVNLVKEAPGISANETMWEVVAGIPLSEQEPLACLRELGEGLVKAEVGDPYVAVWGRGVLGWCDLFDATLRG